MTYTIEKVTLPAGETVGYSRKGVLTRDSRIAAIPYEVLTGISNRVKRVYYQD